MKTITVERHSSSWITALAPKSSSGPIRVVDHLGKATLSRAALIIDTLSLAGAVVVQAARPLTWRRTVRREFFRQCHLSGVLALPSFTVIGILVGTGMVFQSVYWLEAVGQLRLVAQLLVRSLVQEIAPLLVGVVIIGRSGAAIAAELANMRADGEIGTLDAMGLDPLIHAVVPRVMALTVAAVGLTVFLTSVALVSGFLLTNALGVGTGNVIESLDAVLKSIEPRVYAAVVAKGVLTGLLVGAVCCRHALVDDGVGGVPGTLSRSFIESLLVIFLVTGLVSLLL